MNIKTSIMVAKEFFRRLLQPRKLVAFNWGSGAESPTTLSLKKPAQSVKKTTEHSEKASYKKITNEKARAIVSERFRESLAGIKKFQKSVVENGGDQAESQFMLPMVLAKSAKKTVKSRSPEWCLDETITEGRRGSRKSPYQVNQAVVEEQIKRLLAMELPIYQVGAKLKDDYTDFKVSWQACVDKVAVSQEENVNSVDDFFQVRPIKTCQEIKQLSPKYQLALSGEELERRLEENSLGVKQYQHQTSGEWNRVYQKQIYLPEGEPSAKCLYLLVDVSGSMQGMDSAEKAVAMVTILVRMNLFNRAKIFFRAFGTEPSAVAIGNSPQTKEEIIKKAYNQDWDELENYVLKAVEAAATDIKQNQEFANAEIVIIADGTSDVNGDFSIIKKVVSKIKNTTIHAVMIAVGEGGASKYLKEICETYSEV